MGRRCTLLASTAVLAIFASNLVFASAPEKDVKPVKVKSPASPVTSTATGSSSSSSKKGDTAPTTLPTPQSSQPVENVSPQAPITAEPAFQPLSSPAVGEQIKWQVISGGGSQASSASYKLGSTIGQTAAGPSSSASYKMNAGFWQNFSSSCCVVEGDANHSGGVNVIDITFLVNRLFKGGPAPFCNDEADANDSGTINVIDITYLVNRLFKGGPITPCP